MSGTNPLLSAIIYSPHACVRQKKAAGTSTAPVYFSCSGWVPSHAGRRFFSCRSCCLSPTEVSLNSAAPNSAHRQLKMHSSLKNLRIMNPEINTNIWEFIDLQVCIYWENGCRSTTQLTNCTFQRTSHVQAVALSLVCTLLIAEPLLTFILI